MCFMVLGWHSVTHNKCFIDFALTLAGLGMLIAKSGTEAYIAGGCSVCKLLWIKVCSMTGM